MERIEHVEIRVGIAELRKLLGVPDGAEVEVFAFCPCSPGLLQANVNAQTNQGRRGVVPLSMCAPGTPIHELRIRFLKDQEQPTRSQRDEP